ncbi:helix-turn-helix domain-containing protein [Mucilaginibacter sp. CSA2-8R]|uniref:helix-turn-helix domain-containing protein n=1 Tax=Mucilaginibacter sp. CSA2-8R TaxID=3141542 RepID=UPI00315D666B
MRHLDIKPAENLRHAIESFWYLSVDFAQLPPAGFEILPDGFAEIIFYFGSPCYLIADNGPMALPSPFLTGLLRKPMYLRADNHMEVIGIRCYPWAVFDLLGISSNQGGVHVFEHVIARLHSPLEALVVSGQIAEALARVQQFFNADCYAVHSPNALSKAGQAMRQGNGTLPVRHVAEAAHTTLRTLERQFKRAAGQTVKDVSGLIRFEQVRDQLWTDPETPIAALAQQLGYADQSHLGREFKRYAGVTVAAFARKIKRHKLTAHHDFVAFVLS